MKYYLKALKNYTNFKGRSNRKEYWFFFLINIIISIVLAVIDNNFRLIIDRDMGIGLLSSIYSLAILLPAIAVSIRRLHDIGKSGKWIFIAFVPIIGGFWLLYLLINKGEEGNNQYGDEPNN
jgi:uncharacterized membrane protein YhaH (DUF805 family)